MDLNDVRSKYLEFFKKRGHTIIPSSSLVPENDPTTLFTGSGMQPLVPYLLGENHPAGVRLADSQKCFRAMDIEEVGDNRHTTFFEMLGNWSFGDYFKKEQIAWMFEFLVDELGLDATHLYITCFIGAPQYSIPKDTEAAELWQKLFRAKGIEADIAEIGTEEAGYERGIKPRERIFYYEDKKNWWNRGKTGTDTTPVGDPCGPDSEMFYEFTDIPHDKKFGEHCHPNCDCGRFMEIGNNVFMAYRKKAEGEFVPLAHPNVDHGSGLERIAAAVANSSDIFPITHAPIIALLEKMSGKKYQGDALIFTRAFRIIADHMKGATFLIASGVVPANTERGYFVRRLIRRSVFYADRLGIRENSFSKIVGPIASMYRDAYPELQKAEEFIQKIIDEEEKKFRQTLSRGLREFKKWYAVVQSDLDFEGRPDGHFVQDGEGDTSSNVGPKRMPGHVAFNLVTTYGFPRELIEEIAKEGNIEVDWDDFDKKMREHQDLSRAGASQRFAGGLADTAEKTVRLHTAHHLLLRALQIVLGPEAKQRGSNITQERLRIDFSYPSKMTQKQLVEVERSVNEKIEEDLPVIRSEMAREEAEALGAEHEFGAKYPERVSVYSIGPRGATEKNPQFDKRFSIEFCGGPHVTHTGELAIDGKKFKIQKEEAVSAGVRRIRAVFTD
ncbi:MAG: alanine--tRNA ligase-related protein [Minisyncoccia bacterium]